MRETMSKTVQNEDMIGFAELSGDHNPIHLSEHFPARRDLAGVLSMDLHGKSYIRGDRHPASGTRFRVHFAVAQLSRSGQDRRHH